jgi:hypothetical protein
MIAEELKHRAGRLQLGLVDVEIDPVEGFQFEDHVVSKDLSDSARQTHSGLAASDFGGDVL